MKNVLRRVGILGVALLFIGSSCHEETPLEQVERCLRESVNRQAFWVQGTWRIRATGRRSGCDDEKYNDEALDIRSKPLRVRQGEHALALDPASADPNAFRFSGTVGDYCMRVMTEETGPGGRTTFDFPGMVSGYGRVTGGFTGTGPRGCSTEGSFVIEIDADPMPSRPTPKVDAGSADARVEPPADASASDTSLADTGTDAADDAPSEASTAPGNDSGDAGDASDFTYIGTGSGNASGAAAAASGDAGSGLGNGSVSCTAVPSGSPANYPVVLCGVLAALALARRRAPRAGVVADESP